VRRQKSLRYRLTRADGGAVYVYAPEHCWPRECAALDAWAAFMSAELCPIDSEPVTVQDGRAAPGV
jgi:hypothetical protein